MVEFETPVVYLNCTVPNEERVFASNINDQWEVQCAARLTPSGIRSYVAYGSKHWSRLNYVGEHAKPDCNYRAVLASCILCPTSTALLRHRDDRKHNRIMSSML